MQDPLWTGRPDPPVPPVGEKGRRPRKSVLVAFSLIPLGFLFWFGGLGIGLGGGGMESENRHVLLRCRPADRGRGLHLPGDDRDIRLRESMSGGSESLCRRNRTGFALQSSIS